MASTSPTRKRRAGARYDTIRGSTSDTPTRNEQACALLQKLHCGNIFRSIAANIAYSDAQQSHLGSVRTMPTTVHRISLYSKLFQLSAGTPTATMAGNALAGPPRDLTRPEGAYIVAHTNLPDHPQIPRGRQAEFTASVAESGTVARQYNTWLGGRPCQLSGTVLETYEQRSALIRFTSEEGPN